MRARLSAQKESLSAIFEAISNSVSDVRGMMHRLQSLDFEGDIHAIEKVGAQKGPVIGKVRAIKKKSGAKKATSAAKTKTGVRDAKARKVGKK